MLHRWNLVKNTGFKNCFEKIASCASLKWYDYGHITPKQKKIYDTKSVSKKNYDTLHTLAMRASMMM